MTERSLAVQGLRMDRGVSEEPTRKISFRARLECETGDGGMAGMKRLEAADEDQVIVVHEAPSRWFLLPGLSRKLDVETTPPHSEVKHVPSRTIALCAHWLNA